MKIALSFPGCHRRGGVERVMLECANYLGAKGHDTHVYAAEIEHARIHPAVKKHQVSMGTADSLRLLTFSRRIRRRLSEHGPADVHGTFGVHCPHDGVLWVQSVHRAWIEISRKRRTPIGRFKQAINPFHPIVLALEERYFGRRKYRKLIALTDDVKRDLMRLYSVPEEDIVVLPNGFSPEEFNHSRAQANRAAVRKELGIANEERAVIFAANELERKGFGPLIRATASLKSHRPKLIVAGRASLKPYQAELRTLGLSDSVIAVGSASDVARYYAAADVFALPTQYEAWGLVIIEAMACGLPVLTSRLAGAAVAVTPGKSGELLENPDDVEEIASKLHRLLNGGYDSGEQISNAVSQYAWSNILARYEQILTECARPPLNS